MSCRQTYNSQGSRVPALGLLQSLLQLKVRSRSDRRPRVQRHRRPTPVRDFTISNTSIILVGDSDCDVTTAAHLGLGFVGLAGDGNDAVLRAAGAQLVLRDLW